jgi:hypothetical protein
LFSLTTFPGGVAPTDIVMAALNLAENPASNVSGLFGLAGAIAAPFQPTLVGVPADFAVHLSTGSTLSISPSSENFPGTVVGGLATPQQVLLTNIGQTAVTFSSSTLLGPNASDFTISNNCGSGSLAANGIAPLKSAIDRRIENSDAGKS